MKILLTGAKGQVGQEVVDLANQLGYEIYPYSKSDLDITNLTQLESAVKSRRPELVINAAAYTAVDKAEQEIEKAYAVNRDGVGRLAEVCKHYDLPLLHISTDYVFDGRKTSAYIEADPRAPLNVYGASKAEGEVLLQKEWEKHVILRTSWVFGKHGPNFVKTILRLALTRPELRIVSDQKGCPTAASDLAGALLRIANEIQHGQPQWGIFHYRGDQATNWYEFAGKIIDLGRDYFPFKLEKLLAITSAEYPTPAKRPMNSLLSMDKIEKAYGLKPSSWEQALVPVIQYIKNKGELREYLSA